jgi:hypothetical protein
MQSCNFHVSSDALIAQRAAAALQQHSGLCPTATDIVTHTDTHTVTPMLLIDTYYQLPLALHRQRVRSSIFAQYALLILTDFCTKGYFSKDDEEFAIRISDGKLRWGHLSLYAVSKVSYCDYPATVKLQ